MLVAALAATAHARGDVAAPSAEPGSRCSPPSLGFGDGEGLNDATMPPTTGELRVAMLFVDFADSPGSSAPESIYQASAPAVAEWATRVSYGRLRVNIVPWLHWLRLPRTLAEYERERFEGAVEAAVAAADPSFDFSSFHALYLVPSMDALASTIVDHEPLRIDGTDLRAWSWVASGSLGRLGPRVLIHETGHVLGLPDLYRSGRLESRHVWDVMTSGPGTGLFGWHRWKLGWLDPGQIVCLTTRGSVRARLGPLERPGGTKAIVVRTGRAAVVAEVRQRLAEDSRLCAKGVLFYRVDFVSGAPGAEGGSVVPIRLRPARNGSSTRCGQAWRAAFDTASRATAWGIRLVLVRRHPDGSYTVRLTRR
jgi:M6 family metalloprotease-like protein